MSEKNILTEKTAVRVRFDEVDSLGIVWHGNYVRYMEDGREAWGRKYGMSYLTVYYTHGFAVPVVKMNIDYKRPLKYGETCFVEVTYVNTEAAKLVFRYRITNEKGEEILTAESVQVFLDKEGNLQLTVPDFFEGWKREKIG